MALLKDDKLTKAAALARIRSGVPVEDVAKELNLPIPLVEEWEESVSTHSYAVAQAATLAPKVLIETLTTTITTNKVDLQEVKANMECAANKLVTEINENPLIAMDLERARTLGILASAVGSLYGALFGKGTTINVLNDNSSNEKPLNKFISRS